MTFLRRAWAVVLLVARRLPGRLGLALASLLGLVVAISLVVAIPLYADAVYYRLFQEKLAGTAERSPYTFIFTYHGGWAGQRQLEEVAAVDDYLSTHAGRRLGLQRELLVRRFRTEPVAVFPADATNYDNERAILTWANFGFSSDLEDHVTLLEGAFPDVGSGAPDVGRPLEVLVAPELADKLGIQAGDSFVAYIEDESDSGQVAVTTLPFRVSGIWQRDDPGSAYWRAQPPQLHDTLLLPEGAFAARVSPYLPDEIYAASWTLVMDGQHVRADEAGRLLRRIVTLEREAATLLPGLNLATSPLDELRAYGSSARLLTVFLYAFSIPIIGLVLTFIGLVAHLTVERQRNEMAVLRSRGATPAQIAGMALAEAIILATLALLLSLPLAQWLAGLIGQTRTFFDLEGANRLQVQMTPAALELGLLAAAVAIVAAVLPALKASRYTIVAYVQERARLARRPWWQRAWLDILLLIPAAYGTYLLREQGSLIAGAALAANPFSNPLLFLVPALAVLAASLLALRLIPLLLACLAWLAAHARRGVGVLLASRHLARSPAAYSTPLLVLILTLSLATYVASLADTLDRHLLAQHSYRTGADIRFGELIDIADARSLALTADSAISASRWLFLPVSTYEEASGVAAATRAGRFPAQPVLAGGEPGTFLGVDRVSFPAAAYWRADFATASLGGLMNNLAARWNGVLVPRSFLARHGLAVGDSLQLEMQGAGVRAPVDVEIVGHFDLFPTWYPGDDPLFVGNLDFLFEQAGSQLPYDVWIGLAPGAEPEVVAEEQLRPLRGGVLRWQGATTEMEAVQGEPARQGLFGLLFIGFAATAVLMALGFLLYVLFSYRRRAVELGAWRASGLSRAQMAAYLAWELFFLLALGGALGVTLGIAASRLYIPYLQIGLEPAALVPPFEIMVAWEAIGQVLALFSLLFLVTLLALMLALQRMRIFQAIKLGESV